MRVTFFFVSPFLAPLGRFSRPPVGPAPNLVPGAESISCDVVFCLAFLFGPRRTSRPGLNPYLVTLPFACLFPQGPFRPTANVARGAESASCHPVWLRVRPLACAFSAGGCRAAPRELYNMLERIAHTYRSGKTYLSFVTQSGLCLRARLSISFPLRLSTLARYVCRCPEKCGRRSQATRDKAHKILTLS